MAEAVAYNPQNRRKSYLKKREQNLAYSAEYNLKRKFGLTKEDYNKLLDFQRGVCAICKGSCSRALAVDHNHKTGKVRGLLCNKCNRGLGYFQDNKELLHNAMVYLTNRDSTIPTIWNSDALEAKMQLFKDNDNYD